MFLCSVCEEEEVSLGRRNLGYVICLDCGEKEANKQSIIKFKRVMPVANKSNYGLITGRSYKEMREQILGRTGKGQI